MADLSDLQVLAAVARACSFRGAASRLGVAASSLSDAVRRLETRLDLRLLNRTTRSVTPTEAGRRLLERVAPALAELSAALDSAADREDEPAGTLRLNVPLIVGQKLLAPIAVPFLAAHPRITLEVTADNDFVDVLAAGYDAGIRYEERIERDMIAVPIGPRRQRFVLAGSPAYLAAQGTPAHPRDLVGHACLQFRFMSGVQPAWEFERAGETVKVVPTGPLVATTIELLIDAACAGAGLVFMFEEYIAPAFRNGTLVEVLADWSPTFPGPRLYYPSRARNPLPLQAFLEFLRGRRERDKRLGSVEDF